MKFGLIIKKFQIDWSKHKTQPYDPLLYGTVLLRLCFQLDKHCRLNKLIGLNEFIDPNELTGFAYLQNRWVFIVTFDPPNLRTKSPILQSRFDFVACDIGVFCLLGGS